jgi:hypothetical protein
LTRGGSGQSGQCPHSLPLDGNVDGREHPVLIHPLILHHRAAGGGQNRPCKPAGTAPDARSLGGRLRQLRGVAYS